MNDPEKDLEDDLPDEWDEDDSWEKQHDAFISNLVEKFAPGIRKFLSDYYGNEFYNLPSETYLEIDRIIKEEIYLFASVFPDELYRHRTITDLKEYDIAMDNYVRDNKPVPWQTNEHWFDRDYIHTDDDDDNYPADCDPIDLTEDEQKVKKVIDTIDALQNGTQDFALFMRQGYRVINKDVRQYLEQCAPFDLSVLSAEGFKAIADIIDNYITSLLEELNEAIVPEE